MMITIHPQAINSEEEKLSFAKTELTVSLQHFHERLSLASSKNKKLTVDNKTNLKSLRDMNLQIFCVTGPHFSGKTLLSEAMARAGDYNLISLKKCLIYDMETDAKQEKTIRKNINNLPNISNKYILHVLVENLLLTCDYSNGYIIDGFPMNLKQADIFEKKICPITAIVCLTMHLDAFLIRKVAKEPRINMNLLRMRHVVACKTLKKLHKNYSEKGKIFTMHSNYPPESVVTRVLENLTDFHGFRSKAFHLKSVL